MLDTSPLKFRAFAAWLLLAHAPTMAQTVFWNDYSGRVQRAGFDGSFRRVIVARLLTRPLGVFVDADQGHIYWTDYDEGRIGMTKLDGRDPEFLLTRDDGLKQPRGVAVDAGSGYIYWTDEWRQGLFRAFLADPKVELVAAGSLPNAIAIHPTDGSVFWTDFQQGRIYRAHADGSDPVVIFNQASSYPWGVALNVPNGKLYWTTRGTRKLQRADLDGSNVEDLAVGPLVGPRAIAIDTEHGQLYWMDGDTEISVHRANLDGSDAQLLPSPSGSIGWIALDSLRGKLYSTDKKLLTLQRVDIATADVETIVSNPVYRPWSIAFDAEEGLLFWTDLFAHKVQRCAVDGSDRTEIDASTYSPWGIAIDAYMRKAYWTSITGGFPSIKRANVDGTEPETLLSGHPSVGNPYGIVLDTENERMLWTDNSLHSVRSATLEGSGPVILAGDKTYVNVGGIAIDFYTGDVYWSSSNPSTKERAIMRCHPTNCQPTPAFYLTSAPQMINWLVIDSRSRKAYWTDYGVYAILRANLDGSEREELFPTTDLPLGFTIDSRAPGDMDGDGDVDLRDFAEFQKCVRILSAGQMSSRCVFWDAEPADGLVDLVDLPIVLQVFTGPS